MLETLTIVSNGILIVAIGALYRKVNSQEKGLNNHIVNFTAEITSRPDFDHMNEKIKESEQRFCSKLKPIREAVTKVEEKLLDHLFGTK